VQLAESGDEVFRMRLAALELAGSQTAFLRWLAPKLDWIQPGRCELARHADLARLSAASALLTVKAPAMGGA
jgi:hypothetical protein